MSTYFEDLAAVRPTQMFIIPRLANMMYDKMVSQLELTLDGDEHAKAACRQARPARRRGLPWRPAGDLAARHISFHCACCSWSAQS